MASTTETGHAKNVANLNELVTCVTGFGSAYNPSKQAISLASLKELLVESNNALHSVSEKMPAYTLAVAEREDAFYPLSKLVTKALNSLKATGTTTKTDEGATAIAKKIQGTRATAKKSEEEIATLAAEGKEVKEISTSQMSYDNRLENFYSFIQYLGSIPEYQPNETEVQISTLTAVYEDLKAKNMAVVNAYIPLSNARIARNEVFYKELTGLVDIAFDTKVYVKSLYGASSPQYKQISKLEFRGINP